MKNTVAIIPVTWGLRVSDWKEKECELSYIPLRHYLLRLISIRDGY